MSFAPFSETVCRRRHIARGHFRSRTAQFLPNWRGSKFRLAFVPGPATTVQIMVKESKKFASTGGWGFGRFIDGKLVAEAQRKTCFPCHEANVKQHDFVFTRWAP